MHARAPAPGFTLLEMLLVLVLIAAAMALAMAAFSGSLPGMRLRAAAKDVAAQLRFTRALAISSGQPQDFVLDVRSRRWLAPDGRHGRLPEVGELRFHGASAAQLGGGPEAAARGIVRFFPDGAATGGQLRLAAAGGGWDVDVAWLTGEVRLHRIGEAP
ncbi:GspH/FimT family pseudopilin [Thermomonas sp. S9]|uniref:Type II secretion system protein H n=1 Tax=Thermomonas haemolytica TaxID=141949 RepID=A0A4R3N0I7_9GAMM|nr:MULTISPECIES: GspH/FimT family protein [Thermomonas]MCR6494881.1 GspH/FimT family pseudopilin [Thermomonas sp. S9]TCT20533.1 type II secretion system protein H (GspH) [Thermomonas haemolytica]TNY28926.1 type II secretion system protein GspH [Thermomonas haemolytica]